jgi:hypothetical protein
MKRKTTKNVMVKISLPVQKYHEIFHVVGAGYEVTACS